MLSFFKSFKERKLALLLTICSCISLLNLHTVKAEDSNMKYGLQLGFPGFNFMMPNPFKSVIKAAIGTISNEESKKYPGVNYTLFHGVDGFFEYKVVPLFGGRISTGANKKHLLVFDDEKDKVKQTWDIWGAKLDLAGRFYVGKLVMEDVTYNDLCVFLKFIYSYNFKASREFKEKDEKKNKDDESFDKAINVNYFGIGAGIDYEFPYGLGCGVEYNNGFLSLVDKKEYAKFVGGVESIGDKMDTPRIGTVFLYLSWNVASLMN